MGLKGKLIGSIEVKCGGHLIHDILHADPRNVPNITKINHFEMDHEGESIKIGSIVSWTYNDDGSEKDKIVKEVIEAIDPEEKSITWKVIGGDLLELYDSLTIITACEHEWTTCSFIYEKKTEDTPEPLVPFGFLLNLIKEMEGHLLK
ncbi:kirola-like [Solanum tuberosum]|uniref:Sn-2 protein n=1 Tax=Solanum tuberosum TaxID=4113 RepID=M1C4P4_SOLTU|nr:PREDICTED: kirola-like [Solanum tuberosum]